MAYLRFFMLLIFCLILIVIIIHHLLVLPNSNKKKQIIKSVQEFQHELCSTKPVKRIKTWEEQNCPRQGFVTVKPGARLGNKMWQYITVWGVGRHAGIEAYVPSCLHAELGKLFDSLTLPTLESISHCKIYANNFVSSFKEWNYTYQGILVRSNEFLADIALTWVEDVRKQFTFNKKLVHKSQDILKSFAKHQTNSIFVGVHVRRTDYGMYLKHKYAIKLADTSFYYSAMKYYEDKYVNVTFVMTSDDTKWCAKEFKKKSNVFVVGKQFKTSAGQDLAILSACNHSIFDYGTFGGWGAILAGGEAIYYKIKSKLGRDLTDKLSQLLPNWHAFT